MWWVCEDILFLACSVMVSYAFLRIFPISSMLPILVTYNCSQWSLMTFLYFCILCMYFCVVCCDFSIFVSYFIILILLHTNFFFFFPWSLWLMLCLLFTFWKNQIFILLIFCHSQFCFFFTYFCSDFYDFFFHSTNFGVLPFFFLCLL